jgi:hypothetical protein
LTVWKKKSSFFVLSVFTDKVTIFENFAWKNRLFGFPAMQLISRLLARYT